MSKHYTKEQEIGLKDEEWKQRQILYNLRDYNNSQAEHYGDCMQVCTRSQLYGFVEDGLVSASGEERTMDRQTVYKFIKWLINFNYIAQRDNGAVTNQTKYDIFIDKVNERLETLRVKQVYFIESKKGKM